VTADLPPDGRVEGEAEGAIRCDGD
jgi:hypothetical protein